MDAAHRALHELEENGKKEKPPKASKVKNKNLKKKTKKGGAIAEGLLTKKDHEKQLKAMKEEMEAAYKKEMERSKAAEQEAAQRRAMEQWKEDAEAAMDRERQQMQEELRHQMSVWKEKMTITMARDAEKQKEENLRAANAALRGAPQGEAPKDGSQVEAPKDALQVEAPKAPQVEAPKDAPQVEAQKDAPQVEAQKNAPQVEAPHDAEEPFGVSVDELEARMTEAGVDAEAEKIRNSSGYDSDVTVPLRRLCTHEDLAAVLNRGSTGETLEATPASTCPSGREASPLRTWNLRWRQGAKERGTRLLMRAGSASTGLLLQ